MEAPEKQWPSAISLHVVISENFDLAQELQCTCYSVRQKNIPQSFFAIFWATAWNFNAKFYTLITYLYSRNGAEGYVIICTNDKVIIFFL